MSITGKTAFGGLLASKLPSSGERIFRRCCTPLGAMAILPSRASDLADSKHFPLCQTSPNSASIRSQLAINSCGGNFLGNVIYEAPSDLGHSDTRSSGNENSCHLQAPGPRRDAAMDPKQAVIMSGLWNGFALGGSERAAALSRRPRCQKQ